MTEIESDMATDTLRGAQAIGAYIGVTVRQANHLLATRQLPAFKQGGHWCMRKSTYKADIAERESRAAKAAWVVRDTTAMAPMSDPERSWHFRRRWVDPPPLKSRRRDPHHEVAPFEILYNTNDPVISKTSTRSQCDLGGAAPMAPADIAAQGRA
jgi:hypothetical protein